MATNELRTDLRITGENAVKAGLKGVGDQAGKTGDQITDLAKDTDHLAQRTDHLAESASKAEAEYKQLVKTFQDTGELDKKLFNRAKRDMKFFAGLKEQLEAELEQAAIEIAGPSGSGSVIGEGIAKGIGAAISAAGPVIYGPLIAGAVAATPFLGAVIASAVVGGVGLGGIAGGIALAAKDSRVEAAAQNLAGTAAAAFGSAAEPFVAATVDSLHTLERASQDVAAKVGQGFATLAPVLKPLTDGVIGLVDEAMPGLLKGFEAAKPVIRAIANELPEIGAALGDFVGMISEDTDGAVIAFENLSDIIQTTLRITGGFIRTMSQIYEFSAKAAVAIGDFFEGVYSAIQKSVGFIFPLAGVLADIFGGTADWARELQEGLDKANDSSGDFSGGLRDVAKEAENAEQQLKDLKDASNELFDITMGLDEATTAYKQSIVDMRDGLVDAKKTLDDNTQAGRDNLGFVRDRINAIETMRDSEAETTLGLEEANKRYADRLIALKSDLLQMGFNKKAVEELIERYLAVPKAITIQVNAKTAGDAAAWSALRSFERQQAAKNKTVGNMFFTEFIEERAAGGPTRAGRTYLVGENGPELWSEGANGYITPAAQTAAMMSGRSGGASASQSMVLGLAPSNSGGLEAALWEYFAHRLRLEGGVVGQYRIPRNAT